MKFSDLLKASLQHNLVLDLAQAHVQTFKKHTHTLKKIARTLLQKVSVAFIVITEAFCYYTVNILKWFPVYEGTKETDTLLIRLVYILQ